MENIDQLIKRLLWKVDKINDNELTYLVHTLIEKTKILNNEAFVDSVTQINNRKIIDYIDNYSIIVMCDIDNFKFVNDTYGHIVGDKILKYIAKVLSQSIRPYDYVCRFGGDEFLISFTNCPLEIAINRIELIRNVLSTCDIIPTPLTISVGISQKKNNQTLNELIKQADEALYLSKSNGKNQLTIYKEPKEKELVKLPKQN